MFTMLMYIFEVQNLSQYSLSKDIHEHINKTNMIQDVMYSAFCCRAFHFFFAGHKRERLAARFASLMEATILKYGPHHLPC